LTAIGHEGLSALASGPWNRADHRRALLEPPCRRRLAQTLAAAVARPRGRAARARAGLGWAGRSWRAWACTTSTGRPRVRSLGVCGPRAPSVAPLPC